SYVAPDWSADWLHREALELRDSLARASHAGRDYAALGTGDQAALDARLRAEFRTNTYDSAAGVVTVSRERATAIRTVAAHYESLFGNGPELILLRTQYAMPDNALPSRHDRAALAAFFFWSSWSAATDRPGESGLSYTSNWPHEPLVGNTM